MKTLQQISVMLNGRLSGNPEACIQGVNSLELAGVEEIAFLAKRDVDPAAFRAAALIVARDNPIDYPNLIYVDDPYLAFAQLLEDFYPATPFCAGVDDRARVSADARLGKNVRLGAFVYVGAGAVIGDDTEIHSGSVVYPGATIGRSCLIYAHVVIREGVVVGDHCIIHAGAVIGSDGFGFSRDSAGIPRKIPQKGRVTIADHCEIGANTCIDRSTLGETRLEEHVKLDNLVQVGHNCRIGSGTTISALTGISGSVDVGRNVVMGGQVGIADHLRIADGVMIAGKTGVSGHIKKRCVISGSPHMEARDWRRMHALLRNLDDYYARIRELEKRIAELEEK
ncbi:MAG: UDP-3-O-(3-hydroxymyristoyl)glucosamine N-acyltransferase [Acidobacteriota bacterium]|jgi:UDP-3-O-[3-hydroxymyristoyl] glucosamine N-acyltransferase|nr:UDP-3-O-(3-hydroxymyristoyl)glucosamine N-acyltransferase [Acidobacteriota bacterium]